jgi:LysM repeat protein
MEPKGILRAVILLACCAVLPAALAGGEALPAFHRLIGDLTAPDRILRYRASEGLGALGDLEAVPYLIDVLEDPDPGLRSLAGAALPRLPGRGWGPDAGRWRGWGAEQGEALIGHRSETGLRAVAALSAPAYEVRFSSARTLETLGFREGIPALIQALGTHELPFRWRCARSLEVLSGERFGLDPARWAAWWEAARAARLPDLPPVQVPVVSPPPAPQPVPQASPRLTLDPEGALEQLARRLEEERDALAQRLRTLEADRARLLDSSSAATGQSQARIAALEQELAARRSSTPLWEAEAQKAALALEGLAREREKAAELSAALARERETSLALVEEAEGLRLKLAERPEPSAPPDVPAPAAVAGSGVHIQDYVIQRDDSLSGIAKRFHTDVETLLNLNMGNTLAIRDRHRIYAGYRINVPAP